MAWYSEIFRYLTNINEIQTLFKANTNINKTKCTYVYARNSKISSHLSLPSKLYIEGSFVPCVNDEMSARVRHSFFACSAMWKNHNMGKLLARFHNHIFVKISKSWRLSNYLQNSEYVSKCFHRFTFNFLRSWVKIWLANILVRKTRQRILIPKVQNKLIHYILLCWTVFTPPRI